MPANPMPANMNEALKTISPPAASADENLYGARERPVAEIDLDGETAVLTDRRLIVTGGGTEMSLALARIGVVRVRFERLQRAMSQGTIALAGAAALALLIAPARNLVATQAQALAQSQLPERGESAAALLQFTAKTLALADFGIALIPAVAGALAVFGIAKIALAVRGRTVVGVSTGGEEIELVRAGRFPALLEFGREVGRNLPDAKKI